MATKQADGKATVRETAGLWRGKPVLAEIHARHLTLRVKGSAISRAIPFNDLYEMLEMRFAKATSGDVPPNFKGRRKYLRNAIKPVDSESVGGLQ